MPVWEPGVYGNPLLSAQFCCEPRTAQKKLKSFLCRNINWYGHYEEQYGGSLKKKKLKIELIIRLSNPTPGHISGEKPNSKRYVHPSVHSSTIYESQDMEAA